ncbi:MAG: PAS domain-containing protein [Nitrospirae bacterium]|nr:MAG: PAS domain-containing protein [Nitrospirota bacterium]
MACLHVCFHDVGHRQAIEFRQQCFQRIWMRHTIPLAPEAGAIISYRRFDFGLRALTPDRLQIARQVRWALEAPFLKEYNIGRRRASMKPIVSMLAKTAEGAILTNPEGKVVFWNKAAERLLGFRASEVIGRACHDVLRGITPDGKPFCSPSCAVLTSLVRGKAVQHFEIQTTTASGTPIWLSVGSLCLPTRQGNCYMIHLFHDITNQAKVKRLARVLYATVCRTAPSPDDTPPSPSEWSPPTTQLLSPREQEILACLKKGMTTRAIADHLCISPVTVRNHVQHILQKLGAHSRLEALALASSSPSRPPAGSRLRNESPGRNVRSQPSSTKPCSFP